MKKREVPCLILSGHHHHHLIPVPSHLLYLTDVYSSLLKLLMFLFSLEGFTTSLTLAAGI